MLARLSLMTLATTHQTTNQAMAPGRGARHEVAIVDEYGFRYDREGNRLDAAGHVIAPPRTPPGARVLP